MAMNRPPGILLLLLASLLAACRAESPARSASRYPIKGRVVEVDLANRSVTLAHEEITGLMPAMTMPFVVDEKHAALLQAMAPADAVTATLVVLDSRYWLEQIVVVKPALEVAGPSPVAHTREPQQGDAVPDVDLVDQSGRALCLAEYRGRALALTFVFTRCPMPDFCPFLMQGFASAHQALVADPALARRTALLTVSFDVEHDTPAVLLGYGRPFQKTQPPFSHWRLATGRPEAIRTLAAAVGLDFREQDRSFTHNLRTVVLGQDGRLRRLFRGNEWKAEELVAELEAAAAN